MGKPEEPVANPSPMTESPKSEPPPSQKQAAPKPGEALAEKTLDELILEHLAKQRYNVVITFSNVGKSYRGDAFVLRDVTMTIEKGDFVCLTGPSGSGKSTLLKLMFGAELPTEGYVDVDGKRLLSLTPSEMSKMRRMIGVIFQDYKLVQWRNVRENVALSLELRGESPRFIEEKVRNVLRWVDLEDKALEFPEHLSGGEQQRVAIARALVADPKSLPMNPRVI